MKRVLPYPLLWLFLVVMWLLLNRSLGLGQILLGAGIALFACWGVAALEPPKPKLRRPGVMLALLGLVLVDIVRSNIEVIILLLRRGPERHQPAFLVIPLELKDPNGLAVLACIVTATPGSAWINYDSARGNVMIHVLDAPDQAAWAETLKQRYEARLLEIFQ
jgi:multicomponent K+:H+ antiporter subunit E